MKSRYRLIRRGARGGLFYCVDTHTRKRTSLQTCDEDAAQQLVEAKNNAERQPILNLHIAKAYLAATDRGINSRTWAQAMQELVLTKSGANRERWERAIKDQAFDLLRDSIVVETRAETVLAVLRRGTISTNVFLRRLHNFCVDMGWLPWPLVPKRQWPPVRFQEKRAIVWEEHQKIVAREHNAERKAFYELAWHLGASQMDLANLSADDINWTEHVISYARRKTGQVAFVRFWDEVARILNALPKAGPLFPYLRTVRSADRATEFKQRCRSVGIEGISLHSYRYAWAERAKCAGYPERFAQEHLGHNSKAVHRAYARKAQVVVPALEDYERQNKLAPLPVPFHPIVMAG
jgi:integrase